MFVFQNATSKEDDFQPTTSNQNLSTVPTADSDDEFQSVNTSVAVKSRTSTPENSNNGAFLDSDIIIDIVTNASASETSIPRGKKENQYFVIDNDENVRWRAQGKNRKFVEDCGMWKSASLKNTLLCIQQRPVPQYVDLKDGIYSKTVSYKRVSIDPQPDPSSILTLRRMYNSLKRQPDYKRRICWAEIVPTSLTTQENRLQ